MTRAAPVWTPERVAKLKELYPDKTNVELAGIFGTTKHSVDGAGRRHGLYKSPAQRKKAQRGNGPKPKAREQFFAVNRALLDRDTGASTQEMAQAAGISQIRAKSFVEKLRKRGEIVGGDRLAHMRYFLTADAAAAFVLVRQAARPAERAAAIARQKERAQERVVEKNTGKRKEPSLMMKLRALCEQSAERGLSVHEAVEVSPNLSRRTASNCLSRLAGRGLVHSSGHHIQLRYFFRAEDADAWGRKHSAYAMSVKRVAQRKAANDQREAAKAAQVEIKLRRPKRIGELGMPLGWTADHFNLVLKQYETLGPTRIAELVGKSACAVRSAATRRGLKFIPPKKQITVPKVKPERATKPVKAKPPRHSADGPSPSHRAVVGPARIGDPSVDVFSLPRSPGFKHTVAPPLPDPVRTATHSQWGG